MNKLEIINDARKANRIFRHAWGEGFEDAEIDLCLLDRLIQYTMLLAELVDNKVDSETISQ